MSLLAAAVPVAVLVLAWDETTPAVRALVDATEITTLALDSMVVLVPAKVGAPTQEEYLPLAAEPTPLEAVTAPETAEPAEAEVRSFLPTPLVPALASSLSPALGAPSAPTAALAPLAGSVVRVLHLSNFDLPELTALSNQALPRPIWQSSVVLPAAPYLGSQPEVVSSYPSPNSAPAAARPAVTAVTGLLENGVAGLLPTPSVAQPAQQLSALAISAPDYLPAESPLPALDAEADLAPILPDELASDDAPTSTLGNAQAGWSEALASLRMPLPIDEPAAAADLADKASYYAATAGEPAAGTKPAKLLPTSQPFAAPDLNFQVIQYARFAVPVALAQAPFAAIYAPAWPTWLAAQELRFRTRQPLVLHVATLAAGDEESVATATGWQAELQRQALQRADLILAETPALTQRLRRDLGLSPELVRTVPAADAAAVAQALRTARVRSTVNPS